jgi:hypothetical protein
MKLLLYKSHRILSVLFVTSALFPRVLHSKTRSTYHTGNLEISAYIVKKVSKCKLVPEQATTAYRCGGGTAVLTLKFVARWTLVIGLASGSP